ncbi:hypothetical protein BQ8794_40238 [Mesorhizobium prunaredense]|uniref:Uncharacterized protein n=1 Tax=Mesorhizobium prunaredense TaxID=1631249 RepID=A0A1R3VCH6_9HYPH|nr:hypothetical protein BQ8794_40238 [Mesorhizobium prunaredense]
MLIFCRLLMVVKIRVPVFYLLSDKFRWLASCQLQSAQSWRSTCGAMIEKPLAHGLGKGLEAEIEWQ